jgi:Fe-Mn family superoxide dismutase
MFAHVNQETAMDSPLDDRCQQSDLDRRSFLSRSAATLAASGAAASLLAPVQLASAAVTWSEDYALPKLPYAFDALEPHIDAETMMIHHDKHHQAYLDKLKAALETHPELAAQKPTDLLKNLAAIPADIRTAVQNQGGGHVNHTFFWRIMGPGKGGEPSGKLADAINNAFGSFAAFKTKFGEEAGKRFGSGWVWLVKSGDGTLPISIESTANQDSPLSTGKTPIIGLDVWEHAYYLKYRNMRPDYVTAWWNVVNWDQASENFAAVA